ncbi:hypothetical protein M885DRAFT_542560 [Pelagophyceae sp. CCMP2097]|nr:hypothetical protein M885DRAFT_542560 [Pelagophyceae sp. CCMP2097]
MEKFPIIAHTLGGLSINDLEKFASAARFCYGLFKHLRYAKSNKSSPHPAALQKEFYGFYGVVVQVRKKQANTFRYTMHAKDGCLSKLRVAPADVRFVKKGRRGVRVYRGSDGIGTDALATALNCEERERLHAEHRVAKGLEPNYVYNFPRDPLECLYSLEHAFAETTDMKRFFGVGNCEGGQYEARLTIPGGGQQYGSSFHLGSCETEIETLANAFEKMNQKRGAAKKPPLYSLTDTLPEKRFDDEFFVSIDWLRKQSGRKKRWGRNANWTFQQLERSAPLPEVAAGGDELAPDPMLLGELRAIRRRNRWLAARGHAAASTVFCTNLSIEGLVEL